MPIYMDRHDVSEVVTAENVAQLHQEDLKIQHKYNCNGLTYWFDDKRKTAFCLIEAPNEDHIREMHKHAHGEVPHVVIEVEPNIVESFLGRIEDPVKAKNTDLNIINDPAFRIIMVVQIEKSSFSDHQEEESSTLQKSYNKFVFDTLKKFNGSIVKHDSEGFLISFESVSKAVDCAVETQKKITSLFTKNNTRSAHIKIGLSSGVPVTANKTLFEDTIKLAKRLCSISDNKLVLSSEVKDLYLSENINNSIHQEDALTISRTDEGFINELMDFMEKEWKNSDLKVEDFNKPLGLSKSQLYRKLNALTGESPNTYLRKYRLKKALGLIHKRTNNISEIAYDTGFSSLSYFSKCFLKQYSILPSDMYISKET